jgi:hypothetical protein
MAGSNSGGRPAYHESYICICVEVGGHAMRKASKQASQRVPKDFSHRSPSSLHADVHRAGRQAGRQAHT